MQQENRKARNAIGRRAVIGAAGSLLAALLAACGKPNGGDTLFPAAAAPPATTGSTARVSTVVGTLSPPTVPPVVVSSGGTVIAVPTAQRGTPPPDFLRMLAYVPEPASRWNNALTFANLGAVRRLYNFEAIRNVTDLRAQTGAMRDYTDATAGCALSDFTGQVYANGQWRTAFGFDVFQVDREISPGMPPLSFSRMEGVFDSDAVAVALQAGGYLPATTPNGAPYDSVRGDNEANLADPRTGIALGRMNRITASQERIAVAPATVLIESALDAEQRKGTSLDANPTFRALAAALGNVTSVATAAPDVFVAATAVLTPDVVERLTRGYIALRPAELVAMGYTDAGNFGRTMHIALVYANPADAAADEPEVLRRYQSFRSLRTQQLFIPTYATGATSRTVTSGGKGVVVVDLALQRQAVLGRFWFDTWLTRDAPLFRLPASATPATGPVPASTRTP